MKLITILLLCSRLLPSLAQEEGAQEMDCNDETVFQAVDTALKKYNAGLERGNQFVLYRVTESTKKDGAETFYSFKYQIKEGNCSVQSGLTWQDCDYRDAEEAATGECTATLGKRENEFSVATQNCNISLGGVPKETDEFPCFGCLQPIPTDSRDLEPVLKHAMEHFNNNTKHTHLFALRQVKRAHSQVVAGTNYRIIYSIVQTNCSKELFPFLHEDCVPLPHGDNGECRSNTYVNIRNTIAGFSQNCDLYPGDDLHKPLPKNCPGCPRNIPVDSPELKEALGHSIAQLNAENNHPFYFKIDTVRKATSQVVAGVKYVIEFIARETKCSKESNTELTADCETNHLGKSLDCNANVYMRPWENKVFPTVKCRALDMVGFKYGSLGSALPIPKSNIWVWKMNHYWNKVEPGLHFKPTKVVHFYADLEVYGWKGKQMRLYRPPGFSPFRTVRVQETKEGTTRLLNSCEYKGRLLKAGAEPAPEQRAESSQATP